jgi:hypothetical protein
MTSNSPQLWYFWVTLTYRCPKGHSNRINRVYQEGTQGAVMSKVERDDLVCYSCTFSPTPLPVSGLELDVKSRVIDDSQFRELNVGVGVDFSIERLP